MEGNHRLNRGKPPTTIDTAEGPRMAEGRSTTAAHSSRTAGGTLCAQPVTLCRYGSPPHGGRPEHDGGTFKPNGGRHPLRATSYAVLLRKAPARRKAEARRRHIQAERREAPSARNQLRCAATEAPRTAESRSTTAAHSSRTAGGTLCAQPVTLCRYGSPPHGGNCRHGGRPKHDDGTFKPNGVL